MPVKDLFGGYYEQMKFLQKMPLEIGRVLHLFGMDEIDLRLIYNEVKHPQEEERFWVGLFILDMKRELGMNIFDDVIAKYMAISDLSDEQSRDDIWLLAAKLLICSSTIKYDMYDFVRGSEDFSKHLAAVVEDVYAILKNHPHNVFDVQALFSAMGAAMKEYENGDQTLVFLLHDGIPVVGSEIPKFDVDGKTRLDVEYKQVDIIDNSDTQFGPNFRYALLELGATDAVYKTEDSYSWIHLGAVGPFGRIIACRSEVPELTAICNGFWGDFYTYRIPVELILK